MTTDQPTEQTRTTEVPFKSWDGLEDQKEINLGENKLTILKGSNKLSRNPLPFNGACNRSYFSFIFIDSGV